MAVEGPLGSTFNRQMRAASENLGVHADLGFRAMSFMVNLAEISGDSRLMETTIAYWHPPAPPMKTHATLRGSHDFDCEGAGPINLDEHFEPDEPFSAGGLLVPRMVVIDFDVAGHHDISIRVNNGDTDPVDLAIILSNPHNMITSTWQAHVSNPHQRAGSGGSILPVDGVMDRISNADFGSLAAHMLESLTPATFIRAET